MKKAFLLSAVCSLLLLAGYGQNIAINTDASLPNKNAILDIKSGNKGVLIPRMDSMARKRIPNTLGLLVYDITTDNFWYNTGKDWRCIPNDKDRNDKDGDSWLIKGNNNTKDGVNFLGTTNNVPLNIRVNNQPSGRIDSADGNTFWGYGAGGSNSILYNTAIGYQTLYLNTTGFNNAAIGYQSMFRNTTGYNNTANGYQPLYNNSIGQFNVANGTQALYMNTNGNGNAANGFGALFFNSTGSFNTADGTEALYSNSTGGNNTALGSGADVTDGALSNATVIGAYARVDASNKVRIGNSAVTVIEGQVPFTTPSDGRYKFNVLENVAGLDFILHLRPVTYQFDVKRFDANMNHQATKTGGPENYALQTAYDEASRIRRSGFIAQEVEKAANASGYDFSGLIKPKTDQDHYSLSYDAFVVPLVKAIQEQEQIINAQGKKLAEQQQMNEAQNKRIDNLEQQLDELKKLLQPSK